LRGQKNAPLFFVSLLTFKPKASKDLVSVALNASLQARAKSKIQISDGGIVTYR
jgi:hypothetical protein